MSEWKNVRVTACGCVSCRTPRVVCVRGVARGLTALAFASTPSPRKRPRFAADACPDTHAPSLCARRTRIPSHLLPPGLPGNDGRGSKVCQSLPRGPRAQKFLAVPTRAGQTTAQGGSHHPFWAVFHLGGTQHPWQLYSTETRDSNSIRASRSPCTSYLPD